jgi:hypothetical protein
MMCKRDVQWPPGCKENLPEEWVELLEGLLHLNPDKRWGIKEVRNSTE